MKPLKLLSNIFKRSNIVNEEHLAMINTIEKTLSQIKDDTDLIKLEMLISSATGDWLNTWGDWFGVKRLTDEEDENYRNRILAVITKPKNTIPALIATARAYIGDENANVQVYEPYNDLRKFNISKWGSQDRYQDGEYYSVGVADIHIPVPVTPVLRRTVDQAKAAGIRVYYTMLGELGDGQIFDMSAKNPPKSDNLVEIQPRILDLGYGHIFDVGRGSRSGNQTVFFEGAEIIRDIAPALYWKITNSSWHKVWQVAHLSVNEIESMENIPDMPSFPWDAFQEEFISLKKAARSSTLWRSQAVGARSGYKLDPYDLKNPLPFVEPELYFDPQRFLKNSEGKSYSQREIVVEPRFEKRLDGLLSGGRNSWDYRFSETNMRAPYHKPYEIRFTKDETLGELANKTIDELFALNNDAATPDNKGAYKEYFSYKKATRSSLARRSEDTGGISGYPMTDADLKNPLPYEDKGIDFDKQPFVEEVKPNPSLGDTTSYVESKLSPERVASVRSEHGGYGRSGHQTFWMDTRYREVELGSPIELINAQSPTPYKILGDKQIRSIHSTTVDRSTFKHLDGFRKIQADSSLNLSDFYDYTIENTPKKDESVVSSVSKPVTDKEVFSYKRSTRSFSKRRSEFTGGRSGYFLDPTDLLKPIPFVDESPWFSVKEAIKEETKTSIGSDSYIEKDLKLVTPKSELMSGHQVFWNEDVKETTLIRETRKLMASADIKLDSIMGELVYHITTVTDKNSVKPVKGNVDLKANSPMSVKGFQSLNDIANVTLFELYDKEELTTLPKVDKAEVSREFISLSPPTMSWNTKRSDVAGGFSGYELTTSDDDNLLEFKYKNIVVSEDILIEHKEEVEVSSDDLKETQIKVDRKVLDKFTSSGNQELFIGDRITELELGEETRGNDLTSDVELKNIWNWRLELIENGNFLSNRLGFRELCAAKRVNASSSIRLNAVMDETLITLEYRTDINITPAEQESVSYGYASRSGQAFRSGKAGTLDSLAGARSGYKLSSFDLKSPIEFVEKDTIFDKTTVVEAPQTPEMDIRHYKEFELEAAYYGGGVPGGLDCREIEIGEDVKVYNAFSSATLESIYSDMVDIVTTRRDLTSSPEEAVSFYKVVTSSSILGWKGFENLESIYDLSVYELDSLPDLYQNPIQREVVAI